MRRRTRGVPQDDEKKKKKRAMKMNRANEKQPDKEGRKKKNNGRRTIGRVAYDGGLALPQTSVTGLQHWALLEKQNGKVVF